MSRYLRPIVRKTNLEAYYLNAPPTDFLRSTSQTSSKIPSPIFCAQHVVGWAPATNQVLRINYIYLIKYTRWTVRQIKILDMCTELRQGNCARTLNLPQCQDPLPAPLWGPQVISEIARVASHNQKVTSIKPTS
ncbi:hypothetical protein HOY80DRAFT_1027566 [Tuber brumale]|nr:hypothetical protein HOY80DRAFT_1027566 [Tuber brumale]